MKPYITPLIFWIIAVIIALVMFYIAVQCNKAHNETGMWISFSLGFIILLLAIPSIIELRGKLRTPS